MDLKAKVRDRRRAKAKAKAKAKPKPEKRRQEDAAGKPKKAAKRRREDDEAEAPRAGRRQLSEFPACGVKLHLQYPPYVSGRGLEDVYCATSPTLEFVPDANGVPVYIGVGCCNNAGVCHRTYDNNANWDNANCFAGTYDDEANVLGNPKTWDQAVDLCDNEGKELCAAPLTTGIC